jgi:hypothetical protein
MMHRMTRERQRVPRYRLVPPIAAALMQPTHDAFSEVAEDSSGIVAEWLQQLRSIDREGIDPDRRLQRNQHKHQPLFELCSIPIESMHQPGQKRCCDEVDQDRMRIPAMPGELGDFVEKRVGENVEVGERSNHTAPLFLSTLQQCGSIFE